MTPQHLKTWGTSPEVPRIATARTLTIALACLLLSACMGAPVPGREGPIGQEGPQGVMGKPGPAGPQGMNAVPTYRPLFWATCISTLDLVTIASGVAAPGQDGALETALSYSVTLYTDDDLAVSCTAAAGSAQNGSDSKFYPSTLMGAVTGACFASVDLPPYPPPPGNVGYWKFEMLGAPDATYVDDDPGHPLNGFRHVFADNECRTMALGSDLKWIDATFAEAFR